MDSNLFANKLRQNSTLAEQRLWRYLRRKETGFKFRRQQPIGPYIADFYCAAKRLIIELDGSQHTPQKDAARTFYFEQHGATVVRFWNNDVLKNTETVYFEIMRTLDDLSHSSPSPVTPPACHPPPQGGRGSADHTSL